MANPRNTGGLRMVVVELDLYLGCERTVAIVDANLRQVNDVVLGLSGTKSIDDLQALNSVALLKREFDGGDYGGVASRGVF
ncbi:MAG: hypothetical protein CME19_01485 [Gemmatimonadetes bacterium]|nr:hypothetical protein [Gemmatimonadota bacterium]